jgi:hypothetical protein
MPAYRYEISRGDEVVATGHLNHDQPLQVGERLRIGSRSGLVRSIQPQLHNQELHVIVQLSREYDVH